MNKNIDWEKIIDNFNGFEKLAVQYIKSKHKNIKWKKTSQTRDGNADAIAIVMGFQANETQPTQWWMEAKYSTCVNRLTRYRIDSTVVSAIHDGLVERIIFVTNVVIDAKTISDITETLRCSSRCQEVEFYTKNSLEYWLLTNPDIYTDFFQHEDGFKPILSDDFIVSQEITYYDSFSNLTIFKEPQRELIMGKTYEAYIGIWASKDIYNLSINLCNNLKGVKFLAKKKVNLSQGENILRFQFVLKENYGYKSNKSKNLPMPVFEINGVKLQPCQHIAVLEQRTNSLKLMSQEKILQQLHDRYKGYILRTEPYIVTLKGKSDVGKTTILIKFLSECSANKYVIFFREFTENVIENAKILMYLVIYILFPYVSPETIDESYLNNINIVEIKCLLLDFIKYKNDCENVLSYIESLLEKTALFPNNMSINKRIIVLDNMQLLSGKGAFLVSKIICEIYEKHLPVFFIICGQPYYFDFGSYKYLLEHCVTLPLKLELSTDDILSNCDILPEEKYDLAEVKFFDINATSLLLFQRYLFSEKAKISNIQELLISLRLFWLSDIIERHILDCFKTVFAQGQSYRILLDKIYWSCQPTNFSEISEYESEINNLLKSSLIRYNTNGDIIANNSVYQMCYRKHFLPDIQNLNYSSGSPEDLRIKFLSSRDLKVLLECMEKIESLFHTGSYFELEYILKDVFISNDHTVIKNIFEPYEYYRLYYIFAYAIHQNGETSKSKEAFTKIQQETEKYYQANLLQLSLRCLWELGVISYENMEYENVLAQRKEAEKLIKKISDITHENTDVRYYINYHDFRVLEALIYKECQCQQAEKLYNEYSADMETFGFHYRALSFSARYALTLCCTDVDRCTELLYATGKTILSECEEHDKHYLWCMFYYYFYKMIVEDNRSYFEQVSYFHEQMHINQYGNYRKKLYALAAYFYSIGDLSMGNQYLFQDTIFPYESPNRYQAFYYETLALHETIKGNFKEAIGYLDIAIDYFKNIESYLIVPIHNKKLLVENKFSSSKIRFLLDDKLDEFTYYIDPKCAW
ncbi:hypothetical protein IJD44_05435 [bacterium]|nr:hypothetical protein [bacterium]